ncbi:5-(carboxyamino)imidazole ribonucleotide synthase [soil metagenome]
MAGGSRPAPTLGILGGGQLGRMTALAAIPLGVRVRFLVPQPSDPIADFGDVTIADWTDAAVLARFAEGCTAVTAESEWAPVDLLAAAAPGLALHPGPDCIATIRHKGRQKQALVEAGLPVAAFRSCVTQEDAYKAAVQFEYPVVVKQFEGSYDGYGNATAQNDDDLTRAWGLLVAEPGAERLGGALVEAFVPFERELSVLVARRPGGESVCYPVADTVQRDHRCHSVTVPAAIPDETAQEARRIALSAVEALGCTGLTAVELFALEDGRILINEVAPRPHNTGHVTIEGCATSQFENHVRAVLDLPLGSTDLLAPAAVMVNILGHRNGTVDFASIPDVLLSEGVHLHLYGKTTVRERRKMGHVTVLGADASDCLRRAEAAAAAVKL